MNTLKGFIVMAGLAISLLLMACAGSTEPFEYQSNTETKPGPGALSGDDGVFTIYRGTPAPLQTEEQAPAETTPATPDAQSDAQ